VDKNEGGGILSLKIKDLPDEELFTCGHTACAGCGGATAVRIAMKVFGKNTAVYAPACCLLVFGGTYPWIAWKVPYLHVAFENTGACISGMKHGLKSIGKDDVLVVGFAGDGGTADIGLQSLSGAVERGEDVIYIMYDNEAYMNTGIQRSGSTPFGAWTTTTPVGKVKAGKEQFKKDIPSIIMAHDPAYLATCSISYPMDYLRKLEKAKNKKGFRFLQVSAPCPTGWKFPTEKTIEIGKMMVESGMWTLLEYEDGVVNITKTPKMTPVKDYLMAQGRFKHMKEEEIARLQAWVNRKWELDSAKAAATQKGKEQKQEA